VGRVLTKTNKIPSAIKDDYWIYVMTEEAKRVEGQNVGKWMLFVPNGKPLDELWTLVRDSTLRGELGIAAKVSTARPNPNAISPENGVVIVYTKNFEDVEDVKRVGYSLLSFVSPPIYYKTDLATITGQYSNRGSFRVSLYGIKKDRTFLTRGVNW